MATWMIYGANGYTGSRIARLASEKGHTPILAGRNERALFHLAESLGCAYRVFDLCDDKVVQNAIQDIDLLLNCAGPFTDTLPGLLPNCIEVKTHYLDITGEIAAFEYCVSQNRYARKADVIMCPGLGFDVVPTDHLASALSNQMEDACNLTLGFSSQSKLSPGTTKTLISGLSMGNFVRLDGKLIRVPLLSGEREVDFGFGTLPARRIPWGDLATAWYSTHIPNIEVLIPIDPNIVKWIPTLRALLWLFRIPGISRFLSTCIGWFKQGPDNISLSEEKTLIWGEVTNSKGHRISARMQVPNGYQLTLLSTLAYIDWLLPQLEKGGISGGYYTPTQLFPPEIFFNLPGVSSIEFDPEQPLGSARVGA